MNQPTPDKSRGFSPKPRGKGPERSGNGQLWFYWGVGAGLWIWTISALVSGSTGILSLTSYLIKAREAKSTVQRIDARLAALSSEVSSLRNDPFSMERQAREREHRLRPGEILVLPGKP
jgi:hypothetical protein